MFILFVEEIRIKVQFGTEILLMLMVVSIKFKMLMLTFSHVHNPDVMAALYLKSLWSVNCPAFTSWLIP